jgi:general secretion pathway protein A
MYTAFYGLREKPFALSPDPRFLYLAGSHREALAHLLYGIEQGEGFIAITGEVGTGKTTLCRTLLERLEGHTELAFLFNPSRSALELMQSICAELGLPAEGLARRALMAQLNDYLLEQRRRGRRVLLIIDEAQTLSETTLEQVRLLSNLETSREKLIQILLLGQPELDRKLDQRSLRQLRQRISVRWKLEPLGPHETRAYVRHRLSVAAGQPKDLFSDAALREIHRRTGGIPRLVNQLCDRALLAGYAARAAQIGPALVRAAAREIPDAARSRAGGRSGSAAPSPRRPWLFFALTLAVVGLALMGGLRVGRSGLVAWLGDAGSLPAVAAAGVDAGSRGARSSVDAPPSDGPVLARLIGAVPPARWQEGTEASAFPGLPGLPGPRGAGDAADPSDLSGPGAGSDAENGSTALAPGLLDRLLDGRSPQGMMAESERILLERFGRRVPPRAFGTSAPSAPSGESSTETLRASIEARGLVATPFDGGSLALLRRLDHPVLLALSAPGDASASGGSAGGSRSILDAVVGRRPDTTRWLAVVGFDGERAHVGGLLPGRTLSVPIAELEDRWLETGIVVWERFEPVPPLLGQGDEGGGVIWLQRALAELRLYTGPVSGRFDATTRAALLRFQRERGLVADGIAGPLTQIALYASLDRYPVPRLSQGPASMPAPNRAEAREPGPFSWRVLPRSIAPSPPASLAFSLAPPLASASRSSHVLALSHTYPHTQVPTRRTRSQQRQWKADRG